MRGFGAKFRLIFLPLVLLSISFLVVYTFLHWLLVVKNGLEVPEEGIILLLPLILAFVFSVIFIDPRLDVLKFQGKFKSLPLVFLATLAVGAPAMIAQEYMLTATGKLSHLADISQVDLNKKTKYYRFDTIVFDNSHAIYHLKTHVSSSSKGRNPRLNYDLYYAVPIVLEHRASTDTVNTFWLCKKYSTHISDKSSSSYKNSFELEFVSRCKLEFWSTDFSQSSYFEVIGNTLNRSECRKLIANAGYNSVIQPIIFKPETGPFEARNGNKLLEVLGFMFFSYGGFLLSITLTPFRLSYRNK
jgi:rhomboid protease GluP